VACAEAACQSLGATCRLGEVSAPYAPILSIHALDSSSKTSCKAAEDVSDWEYANNVADAALTAKNTSRRGRMLGFLKRAYSKARPQMKVEWTDVLDVG